LFSKLNKNGLNDEWERKSVTFPNNNDSKFYSQLYYSFMCVKMTTIDESNYCCIFQHFLYKFEHLL